VAVTAKQLIAAQTLTAAAATYYTVPAATTTRVTEILLTNQDTVDRTVSLHYVAPAGAAANSNRILPAVNVPAGQLVKLKLDSVLPTGAMIQALASVTAVVVIHASGAELT
jgi:hypothetical protein